MLDNKTVIPLPTPTFAGNRLWMRQDGDAVRATFHKWVAIRSTPHGLVLRSLRLLQWPGLVEETRPKTPDPSQP
jgi:hypothetical protein